MIGVSVYNLEGSWKLRKYKVVMTPQNFRTGQETEGAVARLTEDRKWTLVVMTRSPGLPYVFVRTVRGLLRRA